MPDLTPHFSPLSRVRDVQGLLRALMAHDAGRPRLTWYGPGGERIELSAKTLNNWVAKTANLLTDELDAAPGTRVGVSLPPHWRTVVWLLAIWSTGAHAVLLPSVGAEGESGAEGEAGAVDVLVTDRPDAAGPASTDATLVAVELPALATRFAGPLAPGVLDAATEVRLQPDGFDAPEDPDAADLALTSGSITTSYGNLLEAAAAVGLSAETRLLTAAGPDQAVSAYLAPLLAGGSIVLHGPLPEGDVSRIAAQEGAVR